MTEEIAPDQELCGTPDRTKIMKQNSNRQRLARLVPIVFLALAACASSAGQVESGDGWAHLGWYQEGQEELTIQNGVQLFANLAEIETATGIAVPGGSFDQPESLLLVVANHSDGCGPAFYSDVVPTETGLRLVTAPSESSATCPDIGIAGVSVFLVDKAVFPDHNGEITFERDDRGRVEQVSILVPG